MSIVSLESSNLNHNHRRLKLLRRRMRLLHRLHQMMAGQAAMVSRSDQESNVSAAPCALPDVEPARDADLYYVGRVVMPLSKLPKWKRRIIRFCYWLTGYCAGVESQGIFEHEEIAERVASPPGWFYQPLPRNGLLPEQSCSYKGARFPSSDSPEVAARGNASPVLLPVTVTTTESLERLRQKIQATDYLVQAYRGGNKSGNAKSAYD